MERRQPDFEDEKIRYWKAEERDVAPERDPSVLEIDLAREEIFESRVYSVTNDALGSIALQILEDYPDLPTFPVFVSLVESLSDASFRILAKRNLSDHLLTWVHVSQLGGTKSLLERVDLRPEEEFRSFVSAFEDDVLGANVAHPPTVVTLEEWQAHTLREERPNP